MMFPILGPIKQQPPIRLPMYKTDAGRIEPWGWTECRLLVQCDRSVPSPYRCLKENSGIFATSRNTVQGLHERTHWGKRSHGLQVFLQPISRFLQYTPGEWSKATDQEVYTMCKSIVIRTTEFSKSLTADKQRRVLLNLAFTSPAFFALLWSTTDILQVLLIDSMGLIRSWQCQFAWF